MMEFLTSERICVFSNVVLNEAFEGVRGMHVIL